MAVESRVTLTDAQEMHRRTLAQETFEVLNTNEYCTKYGYLWSEEWRDNGPHSLHDVVATGWRRVFRPEEVVTEVKKNLVETKSPALLRWVEAGA